MVSKPLFVIKYGGNVPPSQIKEICSSNKSIVIVHGGGKKINENLKKQNIKPKFIQGLRYTDKKTLEVVVDTLSKINKNIVETLKKRRMKAVGLFADMILSERIEKLGFVGRPKSIRTNFLCSLLKNGYIPVIAPISCDNSGDLLNVNADEVASIISVGLKASKLIFVTDVGGILDKKNKIINEIKVNEINNLIKSKVVKGGMLPKIKSCKNAVLCGVKEVLITDRFSLKSKSSLKGTVIKM